MDMDNVRPKRIGRPPGDGENNMVQTALRLPASLLEFYRNSGNASDHMRRALQAYRDGNYQKQDGEEA